MSSDWRSWARSTTDTSPSSGLGDGLALLMHAATQEEVGHVPLHAGHTLFFEVDDPDGWARRLNDAGLKATVPPTSHGEPW
jgi:hypothetical protein